MQVLIEHRFSGKTLEEIAVEIGVTSRTLRRWRDDPDFDAAYQTALEKWKQDLSDIRFADKKERLRALQGLYEQTPFSGGVDARTELEVLNVGVKAKLIDQIAEEVGDKVLKRELSGPGGGPIEYLDLQRQADADLDEWEKENEPDDEE